MDIRNTGRDRRSFLKKSMLVSSFGIISKRSLSTDFYGRFHRLNTDLRSLILDAGIELSNAYFWGIKSHEYLIQLAKQMDTLGAVAGLNPEWVGMKGRDPWDSQVISGVKRAWAEQGLNYNVVEGPPSLGHKTKLGLEGRDEEIENFILFMKNLKRAGVDVICYNWMPIGWFRTNMARPGRGGALMTSFDYAKIEDNEVTRLGYHDKDKMWDTLEYFLKAVVPYAEEYGVKLAMHPDDPQVDSIRGISRIMTSAENFERMMDIYPSKYNGVTFCQGNFALMGVSIPDLIRKWGKDKIHFVHFRNVQDLSGEVPSTNFTECFHDEGQIDMYESMKAYYEIGFKGAIRPDHVPTMAGEENIRAGYMDLGNLFAMGYIKGLLESVIKN